MTTMTLQIAELEVGTDKEVFWARITGVNSRGRVPIKFRGAAATALSERINATLGEGETIASKKLFVEVEGAWENFVNAQGRNIRFFKPTKFDLPQGPSLELARLRSDATKVIQNAEVLRKAGCVAQAYKMITEFAAELAHLPLDLSELIESDNELIGAIGEEDHNPEAAAAAHYLREERIEQAEAAAEQNSEPESTPDPVDVDLDDIVLSNDGAVGEVAVENEEDVSEETLEAIRTGARIEAALAASALQEAAATSEDEMVLDGSDEAEAEESLSDDAGQANDDEPEVVQPARAAPVRRMFGRR